MLEVTGPSIKFQIAKRHKRDPKFSSLVLYAYQHQCTVCGYASRLGDKHIGLEAAHIKWHSASGGNDIRNGLSLCATDHKLYDYGICTL